MKEHKLLKRIRNSALLIFIAAIFSIVYAVTYTYAEPRAYDFMTKNILVNRLPFDQTKQNYASDDIKLIVIDDKTELKYRWPWKRELYCKFFDYLQKYAKPRVVIYDALVLTEDKEHPESDKRFFNSLSKFDNLVVGFRPTFEEWENAKDGQEYSKKFAEKFSLKNVTAVSQPEYSLYSSISPFPDEYFNAVEHVGSVAVLQGFISGNLEYYARDNVYRNYSYVLNYDNRWYPSMALAAYLTANGNPPVSINSNNISFPSKKYKVPQKTSKYQMFTPIKFYKLKDSGMYSHDKYSAVDIMDSYDNIIAGKKPVIDPKVFDGKVVFIGANVISGAGLNDNLSTPVNDTFPGVEYLATAADNILHNDFLFVLPDWVNVLLTILSMFLVFKITQIKDLFKAVVSILGVVFAYLFLCCVCFYYCVIINVITPIVMIVMTLIAAYIYKFLVENRNKEKVKAAMGKYMSEDVMKRVISNIDNLGLGGKKAAVTVLFSDIRGFTSLSETMSAQQVSEILNEYFTEMEPIITKYNGIINKFIGDAVMAIFGEPIQDENHPSNAVKCGYEMLLKVQELHKKWALEGKPLIEIGIGINTGDVFVGNIGSVNRMEYTVIGDTVNLASRLESYNKVYKTKMLISSTTYFASKDILEAKKIPDVEIRGKSHKMDIYEVIKVNLK